MLILLTCLYVKPSNEGLAWEARERLEFHKSIRLYCIKLLKYHEYCMQAIRNATQFR